MGIVNASDELDKQIWQATFALGCVERLYPGLASQCRQEIERKIMTNAKIHPRFWWSLRQRVSRLVTGPQRAVGPESGRGNPA